MKTEKVIIELDKPRSIVFDMDAFYELEKVYGSVTKAFYALSNDLRSIYHFIQYALDEYLSIDDIELMINLDNREQITKKILHAVSIALPKSDKQESTETNTESWDWGWLYYAGTVLLNMSEEAFWSCTPKKLFILVEQHKRYHGLNGDEKGQGQAPAGYIDQFI